MSRNILQDENDNNNNKKKDDDLHVIYIHLDLGIGGAEQLVLQLATASQELGHNVNLVTTNCDPTHCFDAFKPPNGRLSNNVYVVGNFLPSSLPIIGFTVFCSTIRLLYCTFYVILNYTKIFNKRVDVIVIDGLPTPIPFLLSFISNISILFYCHFPEKLLLQQLQKHGSTTASTTTSSSFLSWVKQFYRTILDIIEEGTMGLADTLVVNSKFTLSKVQQAYPNLINNYNVQEDNSNNDDDNDEMNQETITTKVSTIEVLYPAIDTSHISETILKETNEKTKHSPIVSLNRFERKKNIELLIYAYAKVLAKLKEDQSNNILPPPVIIAGGYDKRCIENVEYRGELQKIAEELNIEVSPSSSSNDDDADALLPKPGTIQFLLDISDKKRTELFQIALCVVYTPTEEHFGIVPIEAMISGTPVIACSSGGPLETIIDNETGYLCPPISNEFCNALLKLILNPSNATMMGIKSKKHVITNFSTKRFTTEWKQLINLTIERGKKRKEEQQRQKQTPKYCLWINTIYYFLEAFIAFCIVFIITWILRQIGILSPGQSMLGAIRTIGVDEL